MGDSLGTLVTDFQGGQNYWGKFFWRPGDFPGLLGTGLDLPGHCVMRLVEESSRPEAWDGFQSLLKMIEISLSYQYYGTTKYKFFVIFPTVEKLCEKVSVGFESHLLQYS